MLFEGTEEFQAEQTRIAHHVLSEDPGKNRGSLTRNKAGRHGVGCRDCEMDGLGHSKNMLAGDAGAKSTDIKGFSELNEFGP